jgi:hypothetical protein
MRNLKTITGFIIILCTCFGASAQIGIGTINLPVKEGILNNRV